MSDSGGDADVGPLIADLVTTLRELEAEFEPRTERGLPRPPSPREMMRFTSDVAIPGAILMLRTNVEALKLLQRAIRMADGRSPTTGGSADVVRQRAERLSATTLSKLDGALADLQRAVEGSPDHDEARDLLAEARELRADVQSKLAESADAAARGADGSEGADGAGSDADAGDAAVDAGEDPLAGPDVPVDVDAELRSLKEEVNGRDDGPDLPSGDGVDADGDAPDEGADGGSDADDESGGSGPDA